MQIIVLVQEIKQTLENSTKIFPGTLVPGTFAKTTNSLSSHKLRSFPKFSKISKSIMSNMEVGSGNAAQCYFRAFRSKRNNPTHPQR